MDNKYIILDFDKTLYTRDSLIHFYLFCVSKNPLLLFFFPMQLLGAVLYAFGIISTKQFKNLYLLFLSFKSESAIEESATLFWENQYPKHFNKELVNLIHRTEHQIVIITASPILYLKPIVKKFKNVKLIGTILTQRNGIYFIEGENCKGQQKVIEFKKIVNSNAEVIAAYSDSDSDKPILHLAQKSYKVKGQSVVSYA
ncbi:MAG: HAD-IB family phosphatase [Bacteroidia bacterium]|jgi:HAD superfamily phosphoserine phosphatase-like hydrolase|nr:HAD-IB family phosphatase [Bacteroidia bacterium]